MISRRQFTMLSASSTLATGLAMANVTTAHAEGMPKAIRIIVGFPPGGSVDAVARLIADEMKEFVSSVSVENRPGAGGRIALDALKSARADGSVIVLTPGDQITLFPYIFRKLSYDPRMDFLPVLTACTVQFLLTVGSAVPRRVVTLADFIAWCKDNPRLANYGTPGIGTRQHFIGMALAKAAEMEFVHVPYPGAPAAIQDLLAGQIAANISVIANALPHIRSGAVRALMTTAPGRGVSLADVPTANEIGFPALETVEWFGIFLPSATPVDTASALRSVMSTALQTERFKDNLARLSLDQATTPPTDMAGLIKADMDRSLRIVRASGFSPLE